MMKAPHFELPDQNGTVHSLSGYRGKWLVVYFYPKDDTPGCTKEACHFRDTHEKFKKQGIEVIGISKDSIKSHGKFSEKFNLTFPILSDPDHGVIEAFGAWGPKKFMGREFLGTHRNTYIINPEGEIVKEYKDVNPATHSEEVLEDIEGLIAKF